MSRIASLFEALHHSRRRDADRVIRRYRHLVEQAHEYQRKREIETAGSISGRASQTSFTTGETLCSPQI